MKYVSQPHMRCNTTVAPHWGAWIEMTYPRDDTPRVWVAPHWGAWIEIDCNRRQLEKVARRTPLGCVD